MYFFSKFGGINIHLVHVHVHVHVFFVFFKLGVKRASLETATCMFGLSALGLDFCFSE